MIADDVLSAHARALAAALEPVAGQVYFSPECHRAYEKLGFSPSPGLMEGVALPDGPAYFTSRGSVLGQVPGELVAAAFGVFNPAIVVPLVDMGWAITDAPTICSARTVGAVAQLTRILGVDPDGLARATELLQQANDPLRPEGRPLYAGLLALGLPGEPMGNMWRLADRLREFRGDAHVAAWSSAGFDATEIGLLTELYWGLPLRTYIRTRAWSDDDLDAAEARLDPRGLVADGAFTDAGRAGEAVEIVTDKCCRPFIEALGGDCDELVAILGAWSLDITTAGGYPRSGPHQPRRHRVGARSRATCGAGRKASCVSASTFRSTDGSRARRDPAWRGHAEELGFADVWVSDHVAHPRRAGLPVAVPLRPADDAGVGGRGHRRGSGSARACSSLPQHTPLWLANALASLDR